MSTWIEYIEFGLVIYVSICLIFYFLQHYFFFRPEILPRQFQYQYPFPFEEVNFDMEDGGAINGIYFQVPNSLGVIFYLKGNSRSIKGWGKFSRDFVGKGYDFFIFDYRGFGKSSGKRLESILYNDAQAMYKWISTKYPEDKIVILGRSMGSGIAARVASWNKPKMLILDSPYYSFLYHIRQYGFILPLNWLLRYQIRTDQFIKKISCPIFIIHGTKDRLIGFHQSQMLKNLAPDKVMLLPVENGGHNNLPLFPEFHDYLYEILTNEEILSDFPQKKPSVISSPT